MLSSENIDGDVRRFLRDNFPLGGDATQLAEDTSLLEAGVIDSTGVLELVEFIERRFGLNVPDGDLLPENFESIANITRYVLNRLGSFHEHHP